MLGETLVTTWYPLDHTHTAPTAANIVAEAFVRGLLCGTSSLKSKVNAAGLAVPSKSMFFLNLTTKWSNYTWQMVVSERHGRARTAMLMRSRVTGQ